ncbi:MAG: hypothetical protein JRH11_27250 [Deltaproteobacteria bacterium]|nr:hypothetical protein [Deltaproteobacteria bacterium]
MGKAKRKTKKDKRANKELAAQAKAETEARRRRGRIISASVPVVFLGLAAAAYWGLENPSLAGVTLLGGAGIWLLLALGFLGSGIAPRDRDKAGSIDFGNRG